VRYRDGISRLVIFVSEQAGRGVNEKVRRKAGCGRTVATVGDVLEAWGR